MRMNQRGFETYPRIPDIKAERNPKINVRDLAPVFYPVNHLVETVKEGQDDVLGIRIFVRIEIILVGILSQQDCVSRKLKPGRERYHELGNYLEQSPAVGVVNGLVEDKDASKFDDVTKEEKRILDGRIALTFATHSVAKRVRSRRLKI
jgi:hypothetical protein